MTNRRRFIGGALLAAAACILPGCTMFKSMFYELQPYRLHRWNRSEPLGEGSEAYYSIEDRVPAVDVTKTSLKPDDDTN